MKALIESKDELWMEVQQDALSKGIGRKDGGLRAQHVQMYDEAKTERDCIEIRDQGLAEVKRLAALPKEPTMEEQMATMREEIDELKRTAR